MTTYYAETLYPLQDKVLKIIGDLKTPFYLTGGTALSRCYFNHRYSDDLDFFVNKDPSYGSYVVEVTKALEKLGLSDIKKFSDYTSFTVGNILKIDLINDVASHIDDFNSTEIYPKVDNLINILSNKISAVSSRDEPKDAVDIWMIAKANQIDWRQIFIDVSSKAVGIFPPSIVEKLETFPLELLDKINWVEGKKPDPEEFAKDIKLICDQILAS